MKTKPEYFTLKRWRRIRRRQVARATEALMCQLLREIFLEEKIEKAFEKAISDYESGVIEKLTPEEEAALERAHVKLMADLRYHNLEGCFQKSANKKR